jgi:hypothetical protein
MDQRSSSARFVRAVLVSAVILSLAAGAHVIGGGMLPALPILGALGAIVLVPVMVLARSRMSLPVVAGLLGGGQVLLHYAFEALSGSSGCAAIMTAGHTHHVESLAVQCATPATAAMHILQDGPVSPMLLAHTAATLVATLMIARGDTSLERAAAWARARLLRPSAAAPLPVCRVLFVSAWAVLPPRWRNVRPECRRGPPVALFAA